MNYIEVRITLPEDAYNILTYNRYYHQNGGVIYGRYIKNNYPIPLLGKREWNEREHGTLFEGGGCYQINVEFDIEMDKISASCNGLK